MEGNNKVHLVPCEVANTCVCACTYTCLIEWAILIAIRFVGVKLELYSN